MAEAALIGVANSVLRALSSPALKEILLLWNSDKDFKKLQESIETITNFLHDAELRESKEHLVKGWLSRLRAVLYDADDFFDAIAYRALHEKVKVGNPFMKEVRLFFSKSNRKVLKVKTTHAVKDLRERIVDIAKDMSQFNFAIKPNEIEEFPIRLRGRKETHSFVDTVDIIGRDQDRDEIIKLLLLGDHRGQQNFSVISVIGFGGLGKTALAQLVFNDEKVKRDFDLCLWVCINYFSDLKEALMAILTSILGDRPNDNSMNQLQKKLIENIKGKKYLLVLDDVWDHNALNWHKLKGLLNCGRSGSKVLVTARKTNVAKCLSAVKPYYELGVLSKESAWNLFVKVTFEEGELSNDSELVPLGEDIVCKTGYVPLALITIGSMLRCKEKDKKAWLSIVDMELQDILVDDDCSDNIMQVLKVSYNDLPSALKRCFAYCSLFRKDYEFRKDELIHLWIAQGFIPPHGKKSFEEVGDEYFFHMIDRCFFQEVKTYKPYYGWLGYTCKMHDLLHDLAIQVAENECSHFVEKDLENMGEKTAQRHISLDYNPNLKLDNSSMPSQSKTLRTFLLFSNHYLDFQSVDLDSVFASFKVLCALQLSNLNLEKLPASIGELIHLRYLDLSGNDKLVVLPNSICKLHHLQTLVLRECRGLKELSSDLWKLVNLRHLDLAPRIKYLPSGLAALTSLVILYGPIRHHRDGGLRYLDQLDNLCGTISIEFLGKGGPNCIEDARKSNISRKHKLNGMILNWETRIDEMEKEEAKAVLKQLEPNENLQYLKIEGYRGDTLSNWFWSLSNLKELVLIRCSLVYLEDVSCVRSGGSNLFPCLEVLKMDSLRHLKGWRRELADNAPTTILPCLCLSRVSRVAIYDCPNLMDRMPLIGRGIEYLELCRINGKLLSTPYLSCSSRSECHHYSKLQLLRLESIKDLTCLPEGLLRHLTVLKSLKIQQCMELSWVSSRGLAYPTSLEELEISYSENVRLLIKDEDDEKHVPWKTLQRLRRLIVPWQSHLQEGLQYLTSLEELLIYYDEASQVEADNEDMEGRGLLWKLGSLERLQSLDIDFNRIRCSFPEWIQYLLLKELRLVYCEEFIYMSWGILGNMKNLHSLRLEWISKVGSSRVDDCLWVAEQHSQFNSLIELRIINGDIDMVFFNLFIN